MFKCVKFDSSLIQLLCSQNVFSRDKWFFVDARSGYKVYYSEKIWSIQCCYILAMWDV